MSKIALQMYSIRTLPENLLERLELVAKMGFDAVEFAGFGDYDAATLKAKLDEVGLVCQGSHTGYDQLIDHLDEVIAFHKVLGASTIVCPGAHPREGEGYEAGWLRIAAEFNEIGKKVAAAGMQFGYHNHSHEFILTDGVRAEDLLFQNTDPRYVKMQLDTCWVENAGCKALDYMHTYKDAMSLLHIKELTAVGDPTAKPIGTGCIDFPPICAYAHELGVEWYTIEHEGVDDKILADIQQGIDYLRTIVQ